MFKYTIMLYTPHLKKAGTNADVDARILGKNQKATDWRKLDTPNVDDREQGSKDFYQIPTDVALEHVTGLELRVKKADENGPEWNLHSAFIYDFQHKAFYCLPYNQWIRPTSYTDWVYAKLTKVVVTSIGDDLLFGVTPRFFW